MNNRFQASPVGSGDDRFPHGHGLNGRPAKGLRFQRRGRQNEIGEEKCGRHIAAIADQPHLIGKVVFADIVVEFGGIPRIIPGVSDKNCLIICIGNVMQALQEKFLPFQPGQPSGQHQDRSLPVNLPGIDQRIDPLRGHCIRIENIRIDSAKNKTDIAIAMITLRDMSLYTFRNGYYPVTLGHYGAVGVD